MFGNKGKCLFILSILTLCCVPCKADFSDESTMWVLLDFVVLAPIQVFIAAINLIVVLKSIRRNYSLGKGLLYLGVFSFLVCMAKIIFEYNVGFQIEDVIIFDGPCVGVAA